MSSACSINKTTMQRQHNSGNKKALLQLSTATLATCCTATALCKLVPGRPSPGEMLPPFLCRRADSQPPGPASHSSANSVTWDNTRMQLPGVRAFILISLLKRLPLRGLQLEGDACSTRSKKENQA